MTGTRSMTTEHESTARLRAQLSRRRLLRGAGVLSAGGLAAALIGCGADEPAAPAPSTSTQGPSAPTGTPPPGVGSTGGGGGGIADKYPIVGENNWTKLDWSSPAVRGGEFVRAGVHAGQWDLMTVGTGTPHPPYYNGLYRTRMEPGANLWGQEFAPDLAQTTEVTPDFTEWVFTLPPDVKFHDLEPVNGRAMTAEDVAYSFNTYRTAGLWQTPLEAVETVEAIDDTTVKFTTSRPFFALPNVLGMPYYLVFAREHREGPEERWNLQPIGTGPFVMREHRPGETIRAERHPEYWEHDAAGQQLPYLDKMTYLHFADANAAIAAFRVGRVDHINLESNREGFDQLRRSHPQNDYFVQPHWATYQWGLVWQWDNPVFKDDRVRKALSMGVDRQGMVENLLGGAGTPSYPVPFDQQGLEAPLGWDELPATMSYDPTEAKRLLDAAGYGNGLRMSMITPTAPQYVILTQQQWKDIGVDMAFDEKDFVTFQNLLYKKEFSEVAFYGGIAGFDVEVVIRPLYYPGATSNWGNVDDPVVTDALDRLHSVTSVEERQELGREVNTRVLEEALQLYLVGYHTFGTSHPWVRKIAHSTYTTIANWGGANWRYVKLDSTAPDGRGGTPV